MSAMPSFDDLPAEIVLAILSSGALTWREHYSLLLTSHRTSILAKPFLYATFSTDFTYSCAIDQFRPNDNDPAQKDPKALKAEVSAIGPFIANLIRYPEHSTLVRRIELHLRPNAFDLSRMDPQDLELIRDMARERLSPDDSVQRSLLNHISRWDKSREALRSHFVFLLLTLCRDVREIAVRSGSTCLLGGVVRSVGHKFPRLQHVSIDPHFRVEGSRHGECELDSQGHTFWMKMAALQRFEARGAGCGEDPVGAGEEHFCRYKAITDAGRGALRVRELALEECMLPAYSVGHLAAACETLTEFSVSWARGPLHYFLRFSDLARGLARHKTSLVSLVVDASRVAYFNWDDPEEPIPIAETLGLPPPGLKVRGRHPSYMGLGSLAGFSELRHLEISVCALGTFGSVQNMVGMLPEHLESLVLLPPSQHGQPSIDELAEGLRTLGATRLKNLRTVNHALVTDTKQHLS